MEGATVGAMVGCCVGNAVSPKGRGASVTGARVGMLVGCIVGALVLGAMGGTAVGSSVDWGKSCGVGGIVWGSSVVLVTTGDLVGTAVESTVGLVVPPGQTKKSSI